MYMSVQLVPRFRQHVGVFVRSRFDLSGSGQDQSQGSQKKSLVKAEEVMNKTLKGAVADSREITSRMENRKTS